MACGSTWCTRPRPWPAGCGRRTWTARPVRARGRPTTLRSWWTSAEDARAEDACRVVVQHRVHHLGRQVQGLELGQAPFGRDEGIVAAPQELPGQPPSQLADHFGRDAPRRPAGDVDVDGRLALERVDGAPGLDEGARMAVDPLKG